MKLLRIWCGPMCGEKTTSALRAATRYARHGLDVVLVRPGRSKRSHETVVGHLSTKNGEMFPSIDVDTVSEMNLLLNSMSFNILWIDEPTLFTDEESLYETVKERRKFTDILVSGLGATSELEPFGKSMPRLLAVADEVNWLMADCDICKTHGTATRTLYLNGTKTSQVLVGGDETYRPACPSCWTEYNSAK